MIPPSCRVLRGGTLQNIPAADLVKGDVVLLVGTPFGACFACYLLTIFGQRVGDKTPADLLIFSATDLKIDNSSLTGEAEPQERGPNHKGTGARPVEAENLVCPVVLSLTRHSAEVIGFQFDSGGERRSMGWYVPRTFMRGICT